MHFSTILALAAPLLATAAPTLGQQYGTFNVTDFSYTCSGKKAPCVWDFYVSDPYSFQNHPAINQKLHCHGNTTTTEFTPGIGSCNDPTNNKYLHINAYVHTTKKAGTKLHLQYVKVPKKNNGFFYFFMGNATVSDDSSQPKNFAVPESSAAASG